MGNTKSFHLQMPLLEGEAPPTLEEWQERVRSRDAIIGEVNSFGCRLLQACAVSSSMGADAFIEWLRERYPGRWLHVERYDADWTDFRVIEYTPEGERRIRVYEYARTETDEVHEVPAPGHP